MAEIIGSKILKLVKLDSTNNYATANALKNNWPEGTVVLAEEQLSGRGQRNNKWESKAGQNLLLSIVLYPGFLPVQLQFLLSKVIALGVADVVKLFAEEVRIKWPNDIYVGDKKVAGILIETSITGHELGTCVAGIGLNVNQLVFESDAPNPVSLAQLRNRKLKRNEVFNLLTEAIDQWYGTLCRADTGRIDKHYLDRLYRYGLAASYRDKNGIFQGTITGLNEIGQLQIEDESGHLRTYHFKEVEFLSSG